MLRAVSRLLPTMSALVVASFAASSAYADVILIQSGSPSVDQTETCTNNATSISNSCVSITRAPSWQPNNPGFAPGSSGFEDIGSSAAVWVSFATTGFPPDHTFVAPGNSMTITYTFMAPPEAQFMGHLWSDNMSDIYLDGMFVTGGSAYGGGTSFGAGGGYALSGTLGAGSGGGDLTTHTLEITTTQGAGGRNNATNPFGALFVAEVAEITSDSVPEPASLALMGLGLAFAGATRRRRA